MSARPIGNLVPGILAQAVGLSRLAEFLECFPADEREVWVTAFLEGQVISIQEARLLREPLAGAA